MAELLGADGGGAGEQAAPEGDEADDAMGVDAEGAVGVEAGVAVAFGEAFAIWAEDEGEMAVGGFGGEVEGAVEEELAGGAVEEVVAANDVGDSLAGVVDDDGELVGGLAGAEWVAFGPDDEVADDFGDVKALGAGEGVVEGGVAGVDGEAPTGGVVGEG